MQCTYEWGCVRMAADNSAGLCIDHQYMLDNKEREAMEILDYCTLTTKGGIIFRFESKRDIRDKVSFVTTDRSGFVIHEHIKEGHDMTFAEYIASRVPGLFA